MIGDILDAKYRIIRLLGQGGMGSVYEAEQVGTGQRVAVKLIRGDVLDTNASLVRRFQREVKAVGAIESPHIARLLDAGTNPTTNAPYMVMEYLVGEDFHQLLERTGPLPPMAVLRIAAQVCLGLQTAHEAHITHRDIKPANLFLVRPEGPEIVVKILDFGIAKIKEDLPLGADTTELTRTGGVLGSPRYMSPEQARGRKDVDPRSDIWSLGGVLYRALTGQASHASALDLVELAVAICTKTPTPVQDLAPWVRPEVAAIVEKALQIEPEDRFQSAAAMLEAIQPLLEGSPSLSEEALVPLGEAERAFVAPKLARPASKGVNASMVDTVAPTPSGPVFLPGIAAEKDAGLTEQTAVHPSPRAVWVFAAMGAVALAGAGTALLWPKAPRAEPAPVTIDSAQNADKSDIERMAAQARNAERMAAARAHQDDPSTALALLREIEPGPALPRGWDEITRAAGYAGVAIRVLRHDGAVFSAVYSSDGRRIVSASGDRTIRIWNADGTGEPLVLRGHEGAVLSAEFSPDGRRIVSGSTDKTVRVWNADGTGEPLVLRGHDGAIQATAFSPDGRLIVSGATDKTLRIWHADGTGQPLVLRGHDDVIEWAAWSPDGKRVVSASNDKTVRVWDADGRRRPLVLRGHDDIVESAELSLDGRRIVSGSNDKTVRVWSADGAGRPLVLRGHDDVVESAAFSPDGKRIVSASDDRTVRVWNADGTGLPLVLRGHEGVVRARFSPDGERIVSGSEDQTVRVWRADGAGLPLVLGHESAVLSAAFSPDGRRIVSASDDKTLRVWRADGTGEPLVLRGHEARIFSVAFSADGRRIASASGDKTVRVWDVDGTSEPLVLRGHDDAAMSAAWSADGRFIVSASRDKTVRVWNADGTGEPLVLRGHDDRVSWAAWSADGKRIVSASNDKTVRVWNADGSGEPLVLRGHEDVVGSAAFSPDGKRIASGSGDKTLRIWNADGTGEPLVLRGHEDLVSLRAENPWSPDGAHIVSSSLDGTVRIWNADGTGEAIVLYRSRKRGNSASWSPDGKSIVVALEDKTVMVFRDVEPLRGPDDPALWAASTYCMPLEVRKRLLGFPEEVSRKDLERCERRVREVSASSAPR